LLLLLLLELRELLLLVLRELLLLELRDPVRRVPAADAAASLRAAVAGRVPLLLAGCAAEAMRTAWAPVALAAELALELAVWMSWSYWRCCCGGGGGGTPVSAAA
jgi:hypothetical protein